MPALTDGEDDALLANRLSPSLQRDLDAWAAAMSQLMWVQTQERKTWPPDTRELAPLVDQGRRLARRVAATLEGEADVVYLNELTGDLEVVEPFRPQ